MYCTVYAFKTWSAMVLQKSLHQYSVELRQTIWDFDEVSYPGNPEVP